MSVPTDKVENIDGPVRAGSRKRPRWVITLTLTDEEQARGLAAYLPSGTAVGPTSGSPLVTWIIGDAGYDQLPPRDALLAVDEVSSARKPDGGWQVVIHARRREDLVPLEVPG
jgi:hypothetical protein